MRKNTLFRFFVLAIGLAGLCHTGLPMPAAAAERAALADTAPYAVLGSVLSLHRGGYSATGPEVKVIGVGGGDPAMNGEFLYVVIDHNSKILVWETGINVRSVEKVGFLPGNKILLEVKEDYMSSNASIVSRKKTYRLRFHMQEDVLQDRLTVENKE